MIVGGHVLNFFAHEMMGHSEGLARGIAMPPLPEGLVSSIDKNSATDNRHGWSQTPSSSSSVLGTGFFRVGKEESANTDENINSRWMVASAASTAAVKESQRESVKMSNMLKSEEEYQQLSPIERALRVLGDELVTVKQEFDERSINGITITTEQARRIISCLLDGVVPNVKDTIDNYRGELQKLNDMTFSEFIILYSEKFYFDALRIRHDKTMGEVDTLHSTIVSTGLSIEEAEVVLKEEEEDREWEKIMRDEMEQHNVNRTVDYLVKESIQEEGQDFAYRVNAAFRRFDVYGHDINKKDDVEESGFIMLDDAPDALIAVGLPIERAEAEDLINDLSSGASSDFRGFNLTEFRMVCGRVLNVFEEDNEEGGRTPQSSNFNSSNRK
jgi:hypothetical protein